LDNTDRSMTDSAKPSVSRTIYQRVLHVAFPHSLV
jgi:hypothetical protein